jgi:hypothetical protein
METKNFVFEYVVLNEQLKELNKSLIKEKRKVKRLAFKKLKRKVLRKLKIVKHLAVQNLLNYSNIFIIDSTAISINPIKHYRYLKDYRLNFLIAYNFNLGYGWALMTKIINRIARKDMEKLRERIYVNCDNPIILCDLRNKYASQVDKTVSQTIERLFGWIKKPIYSVIQDIKETITFEELLELYKIKFEQFNIIPINF